MQEREQNKPYGIYNMLELEKGRKRECVWGRGREKEGRIGREEKREMKEKGKIG